MVWMGHDFVARYLVIAPHNGAQFDKTRHYSYFLARLSQLRANKKVMYAQKTS